MEKEQWRTATDWRCPIGWRGRDYWPRGEKDDGSVHNGKIRGTNHRHGVWAAGRKASSTMFVALGVRRRCVREIPMAGGHQPADVAQDNQRQE